MTVLRLSVTKSIHSTNRNCEFTVSFKLPSPPERLTLLPLVRNWHGNKSGGCKFTSQRQIALMREIQSPILPIIEQDMLNCIPPMSDSVAVTNRRKAGSAGVRTEDLVSW